jgi:hypothetical protein
MIGYDRPLKAEWIYKSLQLVEVGHNPKEYYEGYDNIDTWRLNNSDDASMVSVRLTEVDPGLDVQINGGISSTLCSTYGYNPSTGQYENYFDDVGVSLNKGSGKYTLRVDKLYGECVSTSINIPTTAPAGATIKINGNIYNSVEMSDQVNYQLISDDLKIVSSTELAEISEYSLMTIPTDAKSCINIFIKSSQIE